MQAYHSLFSTTVSKPLTQSKRSAWHSPCLPLETEDSPIVHFNCVFSTPTLRSQRIFGTLRKPCHLTSPRLLKTLTNPNISSADFYATNPHPAANTNPWRNDSQKAGIPSPCTAAHAPSRKSLAECGTLLRSCWVPTQSACFRLSELHHNPGSGPFVAQSHQWKKFRLEKLNHNSLTNQRLNNMKRKFVAQQIIRTEK